MTDRMDQHPERERIMTSCNEPSGRGILATLVAAAIVSACASARSDLTSVQPDDYRERHPIVLREQPRHIDIFVGRNAPGLDRRQEEDVTAFARDYAVTGSGGMLAHVPAGPQQSHKGLRDIQSALSRGGAGGARLQVVSYVPQNPHAAAPIRLAFSKLQATVDSRCDIWTEDLAGGKGMKTLNNQNYPNFGCSYQKNFAAQVANPIDLVRPREEGPIDTEKRLAGIGRLRDATDPSTNWNTKTPGVNTSVTNP